MFPRFAWEQKNKRFAPSLITGREASMLRSYAKRGNEGKMENLIISSDIKAVISDLADILNMTEYDVIKQAVLEYSEKVKAENTVSCLDLAKDLAGCIEDKEDLSFNKAYLNGYGL